MKNIQTVMLTYGIACLKQENPNMLLFIPIKVHSSALKNIGSVVKHYVWPSSGMMCRVTVSPASLISFTMSAWGMLIIDWLLTAMMRSPTLSFPHRSAGLPSIMRPILCGTAKMVWARWVLIHNVNMDTVNIEDMWLFTKWQKSCNLIH